MTDRTPDAPQAPETQAAPEPAAITTRRFGIKLSLATLATVAGTAIAFLQWTGTEPEHLMRAFGLGATPAATGQPSPLPGPPAAPPGASASPPPMPAPPPRAAPVAVWLQAAPGAGSGAAAERLRASLPRLDLAESGAREGAGIEIRVGFVTRFLGEAAGPAGVQLNYAGELTVACQGPAARACPEVPVRVSQGFGTQRRVEIDEALLQAALAEWERAFGARRR
jgi:hypothetical protein